MKCLFLLKQASVCCIITASHQTYYMNKHFVFFWSCIVTAYPSLTEKPPHLQRQQNRTGNNRCTKVDPQNRLAGTSAAACIAKTNTASICSAQASGSGFNRSAECSTRSPCAACRRQQHCCFATFPTSSSISTCPSPGCGKSRGCPRPSVYCFLSALLIISQQFIAMPGRHVHAPRIRLCPWHRGRHSLPASNYQGSSVRE